MRKAGLLMGLGALVVAIPARSRIDGRREPVRRIVAPVALAEHAG